MLSALVLYITVDPRRALFALPAILWWLLRATPPIAEDGALSRLRHFAAVADRQRRNAGPDAMVAVIADAIVVGSIHHCRSRRPNPKRTTARNNVGSNHACN